MKYKDNAPNTLKELSEIKDKLIEEHYTVSISWTRGALIRDTSGKYQI
jgi:hypothetical protein